jgi:hypothetical protein
MSVRRLALTAAAMAGIAVALARLTPAVPVMTDVLAHPQRTADTAGTDALVLAATGVLAWLFWAWGAVGLLLTGATALPGLLGSVARCVLGVVLPAGARRSAALLLGVSLGVAGPLLVAPPIPAVASTVDGALRSGTSPPHEWTRPVADWPIRSMSDPQRTSAPDWPQATPPGGFAAGSAVPDWPSATPTGQYVVVRGDCLWSIAADRLLRDGGGPPTAGQVASAVEAWWAANRAVIGPDPNRLLPGQVLRAPDQ